MADLNKDIDKQIIKAVTQKVTGSLKRGFNDQYAEDLKGRIQKRTRLGTARDGSKFPTLAGATKKYRGKYKRNLNSNTTPAKSNITATGQLINSLTVVKLKLNGAVSYIFKLGDRRGLDLSGNTSKIGNQKLNEFMEAKKRAWLGFTPAQLNEIRRDIRQIITKFLK
jgi:hypothetical protein